MKLYKILRVFPRVFSRFFFSANSHHKNDERHTSSSELKLFEFPDILDSSCFCYHKVYNFWSAIIKIDLYTVLVGNMRMIIIFPSLFAKTEVLSLTTV